MAGAGVEVNVDVPQVDGELPRRLRGIQNHGDSASVGHITDIPGGQAGSSIGGNVAHGDQAGAVGDQIGESRQQFFFVQRNLKFFDLDTPSFGQIEPHDYA